MLEFLWKSKPVEAPPPPFDIERERIVRRAHVLKCDLELQDATDAVKEYQGTHFAMNERGARVPRITLNPVWVAEAEYQLHKLVVEVSRKHDAFTLALQKWSEIQ